MGDFYVAFNRLFIPLISLIIGSYIRHVSTELKKKFDSSLDIIDERCIEHKGHAKFITPFVGTQVDICKVFGFEIPKETGQEAWQTSERGISG